LLLEFSISAYYLKNYEEAEKTSNEILDKKIFQKINRLRKI